MLNISIHCFLNVSKLFVEDSVEKMWHRIPCQVLNLAIFIVMAKLFVIQEGCLENSEKLFESVNISEMQDVNSPRNWEENFRKNFTLDQLERQSTLELATNLHLIYMITLGITNLF